MRVYRLLVVRAVALLVTGVSTGALIAPFAFLGPSQDEKPKRFYTTLSPSDIAKARSILEAITSDALADNTPLRQLLEKEVNREMLDAMEGPCLRCSSIRLRCLMPDVSRRIAAAGHTTAGSC